MNLDAPLILTLALDAASFARFDGLRRRHFPPERNLIPAHVTLFHHLPGTERADVERALSEAGASRDPFAVDVTGLRSLGRGVAYRLDSPDLQALRVALAARFRSWLTPQDAQAYRPHVTIQNKAESAAARALLAELQAGFAPFAVTAEGLHLWRYLGGPWEAVATCPFVGSR